MNQVAARPWQRFPPSLPFLSGSRVPVVLPAVLGLALLRCSGDQEPEPPPLPREAQHLLLITVDTLRADRLGCYGGPNPSSPSIDSFAAEGVQFLDCYAQRALTLPSMTSFFTSRYPAEHGVTDNRKAIRTDDVTLAEVLSDHGFHCCCLNASPVLAPGRGNIEQGFKDSDYLLVTDEVRMTRLAAAYVRTKLGRSGREFLWVHFMNPHKPYLPPSPYDRQFDPDYRGRYDGAATTLSQIYVEKRDLEDVDRRHIEALYDGTIAFVDSCVQQILTALDESGMAGQTLVAFASDHGEDLGTHNSYYYHANSIYRSSTQIPLIFRQPEKIPPGRRISGMVESVDFMPTVLSWLGVPSQDLVMRGEDLSDRLSGEREFGKEYAFAQVDESIFSVRTRDWMYVSNSEELTPKHPPLKGHYPMAARELYDLRTDPDELINVVDHNREVADRLELVVQRWVEGLEHRPQGDTMTELRRAELEALGYLEPEEKEEEEEEEEEDR